MPLKYLSDFWRTLVMSLINCKISLFLPWAANCVIINPTNAGIFATTNTRLYVPVVTLSTRDNAKLPKQLKSGCTCTVNWNKYQSKISTQAQNLYLLYFVQVPQEWIEFLFYHSKILPTEQHKQHITSKNRNRTL